MIVACGCSSWVREARSPNSRRPARAGSGDPMKVWVLGSGGREHAMAEALARSPARPEVLVAPGNDGMRDVARVLPLPRSEVPVLVELAEREHVDLTLAGSEEALVRGVWDAFDARRLRLFGPSAAAARLEGSKGHAKECMPRAGIPTAKVEVYSD